jgi:periodic tryptophan protein 1
MSMITATAWVPRGFAAPFPIRYDFNEEEFERISSLAKLQLDEAREDLDEARNGAEEISETKDLSKGKSKAAEISRSTG